MLRRTLSHVTVFCHMLRCAVTCGCVSFEALAHRGGTTFWDWGYAGFYNSCLCLYWHTEKEMAGFKRQACKQKTSRQASKQEGKQTDKDRNNHTSKQRAIKQAGKQASRQASKQAKKHCRENGPVRQIQKPKRASKRTNKNQISHIASMDLGTSRQYEKLKAYS